MVEHTVHTAKRKGGAMLPERATRQKRGEHSTAMGAIVGLGTSWRAVVMIIVVIISTSGCDASRGEGFTWDRDGIHVGTSLAKRDEIAQDKSDAEVAEIVARTGIEQERAAAGIRLERERAAASIERAAAMGEVVRPVVLALGLAAALGIVAMAGGYAAMRSAPALALALEVRKARAFQVGMTVSSDGCQATLTASGYSAGELTEVIAGAPLLDAPRLAELQSRAGDRGVRALLANGELENVLAELPATIPYQVLADA